MKHFLCLFAPVLLISPLFAGCAKEVDYYDYVSEYRSGVYIFSEDGEELKIYCSEREAPYSSDGIKGEMNSTVEIFYRPEKSFDSVKISVGGLDGEMSYQSVTANYYMCFTADDFDAASVDVELTCDGQTKTISAQNVREEGVIDGREALKCVTEYDGARFEKMTEGARFAGEIYVRLLYDEGCFYYVGVCDREGQTHAYLLDGTSGRVLAEKD